MCEQASVLAMIFLFMHDLSWIVLLFIFKLVTVRSYDLLLDVKYFLQTLVGVGSCHWIPTYD